MPRYGALLERKQAREKSRLLLADAMDVMTELQDRKLWNRIDAKLREDRIPGVLGPVPQALGGPFYGLERQPDVANGTQVTVNATEQLLWPSSQTPIPGTMSANNPQYPKLYRLYASGTSTTAVTPGTYTLNARMGALITSPSLSGATGNITPVASATAAQWRCEGWCYIRSGGTSAVATGSFEWTHSGTVGGGGPATATSNATFGGVSATFDITAANCGLVIGCIAATSTTNTFTPQFIGWLSAD